jgi:RNA polymerase sigma-70 factor (ECF subfamily)
MPAQSEIERLYDEHAQAVFAFLLNLMRHEQNTRDVLQEVFVKIARQPDLFRGVRDERRFLIRLAHNTALDLLRRNSTRDKYHERFSEDPGVLFDAGGDPDEETFRAALSSALGELPREQRAVVHLKLWEGLTFEQIADVLGIPPNTAASRYRYGIYNLRARLRLFYEDIQ